MIPGYVPLNAIIDWLIDPNEIPTYEIEKRLLFKFEQLAERVNSHRNGKRRGKK